MAKLDKAARKAAERGAFVGQGIPNSRIAALRPHRSQETFSNPKGPLAGSEPLYAGTKRYTKMHEKGTGQGEQT